MVAFVASVMKRGVIVNTRVSKSPLHVVLKKGGGVAENSCHPFDMFFTF